MALRISTNVASLAAQRQISKSDAELTHSLKALASGSRIVSPGDDAAGLAISETLRGQVGGLRQARSNAENAISLIQVAEGGLNEQNNILIRLRELGIQASSDTVSDTEREYLDTEFQQLVSEFDRIAQTTSFGNKKLLTGSGEKFEFYVGANAGQENIIEYSLDANTTAGNVGIDGMAVASEDDAQSTMEGVDAALDRLNEVRANFGAIQSRLQAASSNLDIQIENVSAARSRISDTDVAYETAKAVQANVLTQLGTSVLAQANNLPMQAERLVSRIF
ncbi:MAG: flagellin FliC [Bdellovibrionales bacterium]|nr:flagellin FliC [Bdellovibrionales bacterium]